MSSLAPASGAPLVNASRFRAAHSADWERLDALVTRIEKGSLKSLSDDDLLDLPILYRTTLSSLSVARDTSLDRAMIEYLEQLSTRAYFQIYGVPTPPGRQVKLFLLDAWPRAVAALWRETLICLLLMFGAAIATYLLVRSDPSWFYSVIPEGLASGRDPSASAGYLRSTLYGGEKNWLATFAVQLFTHNSQVAIFAFALGFAFAVPTVLLILYNGMMLGAIMAVFASKGLGFELSGWLAIHGTTELFAIAIAGAAGMRIGTAVAFPGRLSRTESAVRAGKVAATAMLGCIVMLLCAGILEGVGRQTIDSDGLRFAIGGLMLASWLIYFYGWRGGERNHG